MFSHQNNKFTEVLVYSHLETLRLCDKNQYLPLYTSLDMLFKVGGGGFFEHPLHIFIYNRVICMPHLFYCLADKLSVI